jgi:hypothetical protein
LAEYYGLKSRMRNLLGLSNYIAVFLLFGAVVALFSGQWLAAAVLAAMVAATLSRFGLGFLALSGFGYILFRMGWAVCTIAAFMAVLVIGGLGAVFVLQDSLPSGTESLLIRLRYWETAWEMFELRPALGAARSYILERDALTPAWHPHNSVLSVAVFFGSVGVVAYLVYVAIALRGLASAARDSAVWAGIFIAANMVLLWSLVEVIVLTPAFEILFASLYAFALNHKKL